jgi:hypothetical protein
MRSEVAGLEWSAGRIMPKFQSLSQLDVYDVRAASRDEQMTATIIAGLVNRPQPRIYLLSSDDDLFWLQQAFSATPYSISTQTGSAALHALLSTYRSVIQGMIIYDPALPDTINVATTMAGQQDGIIVSPEMVDELKSEYQLSILDDLRTYAWHNRLEIYQWAQQHLLPNSSARIIAGLNPEAFCGLRSFLVATRAFVYWLDSRLYRPNFSARLLSERFLLRQILASYSAGSVHMGWVIHEQSGVSLASEVGMAVVASDYTLNLEVWMASQLADYELPVAVQKMVPIVERSKVYVSFTMSDGDNLQYCQHRLRTIWQDPARGSVPIGWTLSPLLVQAAPGMAAYYARTASENDEFVAGPSGMGYMYPSRWPQRQLEPFLHQTGELMQALRMTSLNILDVDPVYGTGLPGLANFSWHGMRLTDPRIQHQFAHVLANYGVRGMLTGAGFTGLPAHWKNVDHLPLYNNLGFTATVAQTVKLIKLAALIRRRRPLFLNVYLIAWKMTPTLLQQVVQQLGAEYEYILPSTLLASLPQ